MASGERGESESGKRVIFILCYHHQDARTLKYCRKDRRKSGTQWQSKSRTEVIVVVPVQRGASRVGRGCQPCSRCPSLKQQSLLICRVSHMTSRNREERDSRRAGGWGKAGTRENSISGGRREQIPVDKRRQGNGNNSRTFASFSRYDAPS